MTTRMPVCARTHTHTHPYYILLDRVPGHEAYRGLTEVSKIILVAALRQMVKKYWEGKKKLQVFIGDVWSSVVNCEKVPCVQKLSGISLMICISQKFRHLKY